MKTLGPRGRILTMLLAKVITVCSMGCPRATLDDAMDHLSPRIDDLVRRLAAWSAPNLTSGVRNPVFFDPGVETFATDTCLGGMG
jgi:hypothetical protein